MMAKSRLMKKSRPAGMKKRLLSLAMALALMVGMVPTVAFAGDTNAVQEQAKAQIVNEGGKVYYDKDGNRHTSGTLGENGIVVEMSKTVEATGTENLFDVTLQVKTNQKLTEIPSSTPDAAVMLVLDVSNSMDDCVNCGKEQSDKNHGETETKYYCSGESGTTYYEHWHRYGLFSGRYDCAYCHKTLWEHNEVTTVTGGTCAYRSRLADAQAAALDFLNQFANETGATGDDRRMVAVVSFGSDAKRELDWVNVRTQEGMTAATSAINGVQVGHGHGFGSDYGGTNIEGGLMLAKNILNAGRQNEDQIQDVDYLYTILLTDGNPTYHVEWSSDSTSAINGTQGGGSETAKSDVKDVGTEASSIRSITNLSKLYSICFGTITSQNKKTDVWDTKPFEYWWDANPQTYSDMTVGQWLAAFSSAAYNGQATGLFDSFDSIAGQIAMAAQAWRVTDTMGSNILYQTALPVSNKAGNGTINNVVTMGDDGKSFVWDILSSEFDDNITDVQLSPDGKIISGTLGYTFKYRILLNNVGFTETTTVPTNESAVLKYMVADQNGNWPTDSAALKTGVFAVPQVKGYVADLSFTKIAGDTNKPLQSAQFSLTPNPSGSVNWSGSDTSGADGNIAFTDIPSGYTYTLKETAAPENYNPVADITVTVKYGEITTASTADDGANITRGQLVDPAKQTYRDVTITKTWLKPATETTPDSITVTLKQDGVAMSGYTDFVISKSDCKVEGNTWTYTFQDLPDSKPEGGSYEYTVEEKAVDGYTTTVDGLNITNTASGKTSVFVTKNWILPEGMEAPAIQVALYKGEESTPVEAKTVSDNQTIAFTNLDKYDANGQLIQYTVQEIMDSSYQQVSMTTSNEGGFQHVTFTNTVADETTTISGTKTWNDGGDTASRPDAITVELYVDGDKVAETTTTAADGWEYKFENLSRYEFTRDDNNNNITAVREIKYTVKETAVDGYVSTVIRNNIINTRTGTVDLTVNKVWVSQADHPADVTVQLYANGVASGEPVTFEDNYTFEGLAKYDAQGTLISYSVTETPVAGYTPSYGAVTTDSDGNYQTTITNTENIANDTVKVTVTKTWQQPGNPSNLTATFTLVKNGISMDGEAYTKTITGNGVATFENLPRYTETPVEGGDTLLEENTYTVQEDVPSGYTSTSEKVGPDSNGDVYFHFTNTITDTTSVSVEKTWVKPSDVTAPDVTFTVQRSVDGATWVDAGTIVLTSGQTTGEATGLDKYNDKGQPYIYQVQEVSVPGYSSSMTGGMLEDGTYSYQVTNTINQAYADIPVSKTWIDGNTPDSQRPSVTIDLLQDGIAVASVTFAYDEGKVMATVSKDGVTADPVEATVSGNTWSVKVPNMPLYNSASTATHVYTVSEAQVPAGYKATVANTTVTNKLSGSIDIEITKYWVDPSNTTNRPSITLTLTGSDGSSYPVAVTQSGETVTATLNETALTTVVHGNTWTITVPNLPEYTDAGVKITYTLSESPVTGYTSESVESQPFAIKNTIQQTSDVSITPVKSWANMDVQGVYTPVLPETITVALFRDGVKVDGSEQTVTVGEDGNCTFTSYQNLERYNLTTGQSYNYEVLELDANDSPVKEGGTISFGADNDYTVTYSTESGTTTITNTFKVPAKYLWMVKTHYVHYDYNGNQIATYNNQSKIFAEVESKIVTVNPDDYKLCSNDNLTYVYDADNAGNKTEATLTNQNYLYVLELYYELTDNKPYNPPTPSTDYYKVTVNYYDEDGNTIASSFTSPSIREGSSWDYSDKQLETITVGDVTYTFSYTNGDPISGTNIRSNKVVNLYYTTDEVDIDDPDVPQGELPDDPGTDIDDPDVPQGGLPTDLPDEDVPMADAPATGDTLMAWIAAAAVSGVGLVWLSIMGKKRKDENEG